MNMSLQWLVIVGVGILALTAATHALIHKRDSRAALGWILVCLVFPLVGPILYALLGVNRVQTRARKLDLRTLLAPGADFTPQNGGSVRAERLEGLPTEYSELARISDAVSGLPLVPGNVIEALYDGEEAFPPMLAAIRGAKERVLLSTYIFETNETGGEFVDALSDASARGVEVRVIVDGVGELYSRPRVAGLLARRGVPAARFLPPALLPPRLSLNLRNHRKILVVDRSLAFTGGMNLGDRHLVRSRGKHAVSDIHFRLLGPIVGQLEEVFLRDWQFLTGEHLVRSATSARRGGAICRVISDGPNDDLNRLATILVAALSSARASVAIMTPYFVPPRELIAALQAAALRGVDVDVVLPAKNNLPYVHWATRNLLWEVLERGVRVYYQPPPFVHSKLFLIDDHYAQIGSANLDPRSLRLNFELTVEVYDRAFVTDLHRGFDSARRASHEVSLEEVDGRPFPERVRDSLAWLASPYL